MSISPIQQNITQSWRTTLQTNLSNGGATLQFVDPAIDYIISQISMSIPSGTGGTGIVTINGAFVCGTNSPSLDSADGVPPLYYRANDVLTVTINGVSGGTLCNVTLIGARVTYV